MPLHLRTTLDETAFTLISNVLSSKDHETTHLAYKIIYSSIIAKLIISS